MNRRTLIGVVLAASLLPLTACSDGVSSLDEPASPKSGDSGATSSSITIGTANFTAVLRDAGVKVTVKPNIGTREVLIPALESGDLDLLPEYQGALLHHVDPDSDATEEGAMQNALAAALPDGLEVLPYGRAEDADAFVVTKETAKKYGLRTLGDLAQHNGRLVLGAAPEVKTRQVGVVGLKEVYGVEFKEFKSLDSSGPLVKAALRKGDVDVANLFTTDTDIQADDWVVLTDPKNLIPGQHVVPLINSATATPTVRKVLARLGETLTTEQLTELNRQVDKDRKDPEDVAEAYARAQGLIG
jgi:osmoprotectant transport system substrate-binding protein